MSSFIISKFLIFGIPILFIGMLLFIKTKKLDRKRMELLVSLGLTISCYYCFGFKFELPVETTDTLFIFCLLYSLKIVIQNPKIEMLISFVLVNIIGYYIFSPLLEESAFAYLQWGLLNLLTFVMIKLDGHLTFFISIKSVLIMVLGIAIILNGSLSLGQFIIVAGLLELTLFIGSIIVKREFTSINLTSVISILLCLEFINYGF